MTKNDVSRSDEFNCPVNDERVIIELDKILAAMDYDESESKKDLDAKSRSM